MNSKRLLDWAQPWANCYKNLYSYSIKKGKAGGARLITNFVVTQLVQMLVAGHIGVKSI